MRKQRAIWPFLLASMLFGPRTRYVENGPVHVRHPWDSVELSKAERRGKSYEEIQALRREKWEATRGER